MLPKEAGDSPTAQRPIGLLPMVYRIWAAARNPEVGKWTKSKGQDDAWGGKPGAGAMDAAFSLGAEGEAALEGSLHGSGFLGLQQVLRANPNNGALQSGSGGRVSARISQNGLPAIPSPQ
eukprot:7566477-Heterocapsa_arctica.AAC.1